MTDEPRLAYRLPQPLHVPFRVTGDAPNIAAFVMKRAATEHLIDFTDVVDPDADGYVRGKLDAGAARRTGMKDGYAAMVMRDESVVLLDYTLNLHSAWTGWLDIIGGLTDHRKKNVNLAQEVTAGGLNSCMAILARTHLEQGTLHPAALPVRLPDELVASIAHDVDDGMDQAALRSFLRSCVYHFADDSLLLWHPDQAQTWAAAYDLDFAVFALRVEYAPHRLSRAEQKALRNRTHR